MKNKKIIIVLGIVLSVLIIGGGAFYLGKNYSKIITKNNPPLSPISNIFSCNLNKSYYAPYSFSPASGPKIDRPCNCPDDSYIMNISSRTGMSVVLGNGGDKTIEYQCVNNFKVCSEGYQLTSYSDSKAKERGYPEEFTCTKN